VQYVVLVTAIIPQFYCTMLLLQYAVVVCVCVCVRHRNMQIMPHNSSGNLFFLIPKTTTKFEWDHPLQGHQMRVG